MKQFTDRDGKTWRIDLTIGTVFHVRSASDGRYDLLDPAKDTGGQPLQVVLATDLLQFWECLWLLVEQQADIACEQFGQAMTPDCLLAAQQAFFDEWRDFFHSLRRPDAALAVEAQAQAQETALKLVQEKVSQLDRAKIDRTIRQTVENAMNLAYGSVQESLDAIHDRLPGDNST